MNQINLKIASEIIKYIDDGFSFDDIVKKFPEQHSFIKEIFWSRNLLIKSASQIDTITNDKKNRLLDLRGPVESPYIKSSIFISMNYKIVLPVLVVGLLVLGGIFSRNNRRVAQDVNETTTSQTDSISDLSPAVTENSNVDDILAGFSLDGNEEQFAYSSDGLDESVFAQSELSAIQSENYDF